MVQHSTGSIESIVHVSKMSDSQLITVFERAFFFRGFSPFRQHIILDIISRPSPLSTTRERYLTWYRPSDTVSFCHRAWFYMGRSS